MPSSPQTFHIDVLWRSTAYGLDCPGCGYRVASPDYLRGHGHHAPDICAYCGYPETERDGDLPDVPPLPPGADEG